MSDCAETLLQKYDRPAPRYTSYPPANQFHTGVTEKPYREALAHLDDTAPYAVYVHVPFCEHRCTYCGCYVVQSRRQSIAETYLGYAQKELKLLRGAMPTRPRVASVHIGGGTPTFLAPAQLEALLRSLHEFAGQSSFPELSVELDPRVTTREQLGVLRSGGVNRVSLGVQDSSDEVQAAIGRNQTWETTVSCFRLCRGLGFGGINIDLVYGLPLQTEERFEKTLEDVLSLRPERIAVFGYAHVPWVRHNQTLIDASTLPGPSERMNEARLAHRKASAAGYRHIGLDHFALPQDDLWRAQAEGRLGRSFMGYTPWKGVRMLGIGISSIGDLGHGYFQNEKKLSSYFERLDRSELPIERGFICSRDDVVRRHVIQSILCELQVSRIDFLERFGEELEDYFGPEIERLGTFESDGLVEWDAQALRVTPAGRLFLRNIAMAFDAYAERSSGQGPTFSRAI